MFSGSTPPDAGIGLRSASKAPLDAEVGGRALAPVRHEQAQPVEHQPPESLEILREIVDIRPRPLHRRAGRILRAIEVGRTLDLERERDRRELWVEA
jgi:hypothetical protein